MIIAVDAEADGKMTFSSFVKLQQHARIDLGIRIEVPWHEINAVSLATGKAMGSASTSKQARTVRSEEIEYPGQPVRNSNLYQSLAERRREQLHPPLLGALSTLPS